MSKPETPCHADCLPPGGSPYTGEFWPAKHHPDCQKVKPNAPKAEAQPEPKPAYSALKFQMEETARLEALSLSKPAPPAPKPELSGCEPWCRGEDHDHYCKRRVGRCRRACSICALEPLTAERDALKAQNEEMSEKIEWGKKVEKALQGDVILARTERNKAQAEVEQAQARVLDLKAEVAALTAQLTGVGIVPYLDRMTEIAKRHEAAQAEVQRLRDLIVALSATVDGEKPTGKAIEALEMGRAARAAREAGKA